MNWLHRGALAIWLALPTLALPAGGAHAQEAAVVKRATQLRDTPADSGASVAALEANAVVTRSNERKGPWTRVTTAQGATGWVHMFDLGPPSGSAAPASNAATSGLRGLGGLFGGNSGPTTTATSRSASAAWAPKTLPTRSPTRPLWAGPRPCASMPTRRGSLPARHRCRRAMCRRWPSRHCPPPAAAPAAPSAARRTRTTAPTEEMNMPRTTPAWTRCARLATLAAALAAAPLLAHSQNVMNILNSLGGGLGSALRAVPWRQLRRGTTSSAC